jgi:hypothetical protein
MGILAGIGGGIGLVLLREQLDSTVKSVDVAKNFGVPVLAVIPRIEEPQKLLLQRRKDRRLYIVAGCYFILVLGVLVAEKLSVTSKIISRLSGLFS